MCVSVMSVICDMKSVAMCICMCGCERMGVSADCVYDVSVHECIRMFLRLCACRVYNVTGPEYDIVIKICA